MGTAFLIFRQFEINNDLFGEQHNDLASNHKELNPATLAPRLLWLSTDAARLTSPRRLILACESKNTCKNKKECNQFVDE